MQPVQNRVKWMCLCPENVFLGLCSNIETRRLRLRVETLKNRQTTNHHAWLFETLSVAKNAVGALEHNFVF